MLIKAISILLEESQVPADYLGENWEIFSVILITLGILPWAVLVLYILFFRRYQIKYYFDGNLVNKVNYKKGQTIKLYEYNENNSWYVDPDCEIKFVKQTMPAENIKLYARSAYYFNGE